MRVVGVDPTRRTLCFAVFEGPHRILGWGCTMAQRQEAPRVRGATHKLLDEYKPDFVVLQDLKGSGRGPRAHRATEIVLSEALEYGAGVRLVSREQVRKVFGSPTATKHEIALAIARRFPELKAVLPRRRKLWQPEDDRMNVFDAASFAMTAIVRLTP